MITGFGVAKQSRTTSKTNNFTKTEIKATMSTASFPSPYFIISENEPLFQSLYFFLDVNYSKLVASSHSDQFHASTFSDFIETLRCKTQQSFYIAGSLLTMSLANALNSSKIKFEANDVDIWCYDPEGFEHYAEREAYKNDWDDNMDLDKALEIGEKEKLVRIGIYNVIFSVHAFSMTSLLDSFDFDCCKIGYHVQRNEFMVHQKAKESILEGVVHIDEMYRPIERYVILEYLCFPKRTKDDFMCKYPLHAPFPTKGESTKPDIFGIVHTRVRNLGIDIYDDKAVKAAKELGAIFDRETLQFYIPSDVSLYDFKEYLPFDLKLFSSDTDVDDWKTNGGVLLLQASCAELFMHFASKTNTHWLCEMVDKSLYTVEDVQFLLSDADVSPDIIFEILDPIYFRDRIYDRDNKWGHGIMTENSHVVAEIHEDTLEDLNQRIFLPLQELVTKKNRSVFRISKYSFRGFEMKFEKPSSSNLVRCPIRIEDVENHFRALQTDKRFLKSFLPQSLFSKWSLTNPGQPTLRSLIRDKRTPNHDHPVIIDNRILRLMIEVFFSGNIVKHSILDQFLRAKENVDFVHAIQDSPSKKATSNKPMPHMFVATLRKCHPCLDLRVFFRINDENTFYVILKNALDDFWPNRDQYEYLRRLYNEAEKERSYLSSHRPNTFTLWNIIGPVRDLANYVIFDSWLSKIYIVSVSPYSNNYCGKREEYEVHKMYCGFYGFDCQS